MSFFGGPLVPLFGFLVTSALGFKARVGSALFAIFAEVNVMYIPQDSPLVLHLPTSWRQARSRSITHMHVQSLSLSFFTANVFTGFLQRLFFTFYFQKGEVVALRIFLCNFTCSDKYSKINVISLILSV